MFGSVGWLVSWTGELKNYSIRSQSQDPEFDSCGPYPSLLYLGHDMDSLWLHYAQEHKILTRGHLGLVWLACHEGRSG